MASRTAQKRLLTEYKAIETSPPPYIEAHPNENNILEWFYVITGPPDTPYEGGQYMGTLVFPPDYPFQPPAIRMTTPSGRFIPDTRLCLSISDYHPKTWNPAWSVATILVGLLSFMVGDEHTSGSTRSTLEEKRLLSKRSHHWNLRNARFREQFPRIVEGAESAPKPVEEGTPAGLRSSKKLSESPINSPSVGNGMGKLVLVSGILILVAGFYLVLT